MTLKIDKTQNRIDIQPKNSHGQTQLTIDKAPAANAMAVDAVNQLDTFLAIKDQLRAHTNVETAALENKYVSKAYDDLYKRGVNPIRSEILGTSEFVSLSPGAQGNNLDSNIINLNYGAGGSIKVNQVMRLIDLQRIIRKTILKISGDFLEDYIGFTNKSQQTVIGYMHSVLKANARDLAANKENIPKIISSLIDLALEGTGVYQNHVSNNRSVKKEQDENGEERKTNTGSGKSFDSDTGEPIPPNNTDAGWSKEEKQKKAKRRRMHNKTMDTGKYASKLMNRKSPEYFRCLARFVVYDYLVQNSISFLCGVSELKIRLKDAISIMHTDLEPVDRKPQSDSDTSSSNNSNSPYYLASGAQYAQMNLESQNFTIQNTSDVNEFTIASFLSKNVSNSLNESDSEKYSLASVINLNVNDKEEEKFGSNRQMMLSLFASLLETITFSSLDVEEKNINKDIFTAGTQKNLANSINSLKAFSFTGMVSSQSRFRNLNSNSPELLSGNNLEKVIGSFEQPKQALDELISAISYDTVSGMNVNALNFDNKLHLINSSRFSATSLTGNPTESPVIDYFNKAFFNASANGSPSWNNVVSIGNYSVANYMDPSSLGSFFNNRFDMKEKDGIKYIPHEFSYDDNNKTDQSFLAAADYFFAEGLASEKFNFSSMLNESTNIKSDSNLIIHDLIRIFGLDFDDNGVPEYTDLTGFSPDSNPLKYFYRHCDWLGQILEVASEDLEKHMYLATPIINAGSLDDMTDLAYAIKSTLFGTLTNERGESLIFNQEDENVNNAKTKAAHSMLNDESKFNLEKSWIRLWENELRSLLKDGSTESLTIRPRKYQSNSEKEFDALLSKDGFASNTFDLSNKEDSEGDKIYTSKYIGSNLTGGSHSDNVINTHSQGGLDEDLRKRLYIDTTEGILGSLQEVGANIAGGLTAFFGGYMALSAAFMTGIFSSAGAGTALAGIATFFGSSAFALPIIVILGVIAAVGIIVGISSMFAEEIRTTGKQSGSGFGASGVFSYSMITNAFMTPDSHAVSKDDSESEAQRKIESMAKTGYGAPPGDLFLFTAKPGSDKWDFDWNDNHGYYGGIFKTNTVQRYSVFFTYFASLMNQALAVRYKAGDDKLKVYGYAAQWKGLGDALQRKPKDPNFYSGGDYEESSAAYNFAYMVGKNRIASTTRAIKKRRAKILKPMQFMIQNSREMFRTVSNIRSYLSGNSSKITSGESMAIEFLSKNGYLDNGTTFLNEGLPGYLSNFYQKNFALDFRSDEDESKNPEGISVFPFNKSEGYDIRSLKLMAKLFSQNGYGFTTSENAGRNIILHVGIPAGLLNALRFEAYSKTNEIEYFFSSSIVIHVTKVNSLNPSVKYNARSFVFNTRKYIQEFKDTQKRYSEISKPGEFLLPNHIEKYSDTWSAKDIIENMEIMTANMSSKEYGVGLAGIKKTNNENNEDIYDNDVYQCMLENHVFDYFSKLYLESTTGIDMSEINFQINRDNLYKGEVDESKKEVYASMIQELMARYPAANIDETLSQELSRVGNISKNSIYYSSEERAKSIIGTTCFERVFSIPLNEKSFILKTNLASNAVYVNNANIDLSPRVGLPVEFSKIREDLGHGVVSEYKKSCDPKKTDVSSFIIEVGILKSRNV